MRRILRYAVTMLAAGVLIICAALPAGRAYAERDLLNVLLCGTDGDRAGAVLLLSAERHGGGTLLTSLSGELEADSGDRRVQIASLYALSGAEGIVSALSGLLGIGITGYVTVDMAGFREAVDACGGVEIDLSAEEAACLGEGIPPGIRTLTGEQALGYVRIGGTERQRTFLTAMLRKALGDPDIFRILDLAERLLPYMETDLTTADLMDLILAVLAGAGKGMDTRSFPAPGEYVREADGGMILTDEKAAAERFRRTLPGWD